MTRHVNPRGEEGIALVAGILILFIVFMLGLAIMQTVDVQSHQSGHETAGEAAFNMAESALNAEAFQLESSWPSSSSSTYPATCNQSTTSTTGCPGSSLTSAFNSTYSGVDFSNPTWQVKVLDDTSSGGTSGNYKSYYSDSALNVASPITYDKDGDNRLWVRAQATVQGQKRVIVAQVVRSTATISLPMNVITSGGVSTENNGNKVIIEATDSSSGITGPVNVRCTTTATQPQNGDPCLGWDQSKGQLDPQGAYSSGYVDPNGSFATLSAASLLQLKNTAISNGTYYNGTCPPFGTTGIVYVDNANCSYTAGTWNSNTAPGVLIFGSGTVEFNSNLIFYGIVYMADGQGTVPSTGTTCSAPYMNNVITVHGGAQVYGAIFVDKCGTVDAGEAKFDVNFSTNAFSAFKAWAIPAEAKNTFRILANNGS